MSLQDRLKELRLAHRGLFLLSPDDANGLERHLCEISVLGKDERLEKVGRAGPGNMNCTVRATTPLRSIIVKQSRPWVEKYPQFDAPWDRQMN